MRRFLLALLVSLGLAGPAFALPPLRWTPGDEAAAALARGRPVLEVRPDPDGASGMIHAAIDLAAPPEAVWRVLTDCGLATRMATGLKSCRIVSRDPAGRWDVREHVSKPTLFVPSLRNLFRSDYEAPLGFDFHRVGGDLPVFEGAWRLVPLDEGRRTRVIYEARATVPVAAPRPLARAALRQQVGAALAALKRECLARTGEATKPGA